MAGTRSMVSEVHLSVSIITWDTAVAVTIMCQIQTVEKNKHGSIYAHRVTMVPLRHLETVPVNRKRRSRSLGENGAGIERLRAQGAGSVCGWAWLHAAPGWVPQYLATCAPRHGSVQSFWDPAGWRSAGGSLRQFKKVWAPKVDPHQDCVQEAP